MHPNNRFEWDAPTAGFAACFRAPQADPNVVNLVSELHHFGMKVLPRLETEKAQPDYARKRFSLASAWLAGRLHDSSGMVERDA